MNAATTPQNGLLKEIIAWYLNSGEFNGLPVRGDVAADRRREAIELVRAGLVQVVSEDDYMNPHIRPWPSHRSVGDQVGSLRDLKRTSYAVCLYPTPAAMKGIRLPRRFADRPYAQAMARGRGTLELAFFAVDVLEPYRNDPRYRFGFHDFGVDMSIEDDAYVDEMEPERDKISLRHLGFAYDLSGYDKTDLNSTIIRRVCAFYCDLITLTPEHQQRWKSYQVSDDGLEPHPEWWGMQMGNWADGVGPFTRLFFELQNVNELFERAFDVPLFTTTKRPDDFGWLLRPSQREWDEFVQQLDKVLSENLRHDAFDAVGVDRVDERGQNLGTLTRLQHFMVNHGIATEVARNVLKPLRDVRSARQRPAHALRENISDKTFVHRQVALLSELNDSLVEIRRWLSTHPKNRSWKQPHEDLVDYRM